MLGMFQIFIFFFFLSVSLKGETSTSRQFPNILKIIMEYVPWKLLHSWMCLGCGKCCKRYIIQLNKNEFTAIKRVWPDAVEERRGRYYLRKVGNICLFQSGNLCGLQPLGLKPIACRVWPFYFSSQPVRDWDDREYKSQFLCRGKEYFVYANTKCYGINKGRTADLRRLIIEVITMYDNPTVHQHYSTSIQHLEEDIANPIRSELGQQLLADAARLKKDIAPVETVEEDIQPSILKSDDLMVNNDDRHERIAQIREVNRITNYELRITNSD